MILLKDFLNKYLGSSKGYPDDNSYRGQCLSIVKLYIKEVLGLDNPPPSGTNSAYGYWSNFPDPLGTILEKVDNTPSLIPEEGWIVVWKPWSGNQYGHIAIVGKGCTTKVLNNYAQNWTSKVFQKESQNYNNVVGFLRPKSQGGGNEMEEIKKELEELRVKYAQLEGTVAEKNEAIRQLTENEKRWHDVFVEEREKNEKITKELEEAKKILKISQENAEALLTDNKEKIEKLESCQKELESVSRKIGKLEEEMEKISKENADNWRRYKESREEIRVLKKQKDIAELSVWELILATFNVLFKRKNEE